MDISDYERRPKSDFKETVNLPIAVPIWSVIVLLASLIWFGGIAMQKLNTVIENSAKTDSRVSVISDKQSDGVADMKVMKSSIDDLKSSENDLKSRVAVLELRHK